MRRRSPRRCSKPSARANTARRKFRSPRCALGSRFNVGPFDIELVSVAHSIPESNALILRTPHGNVLHTGDWKLDPTPVLGPADRRGEAARARRRGLPRADRRFHQCRARRPLAVGIRRRQDADRADREGAAARRGDDLRLQCRAHQGGRRCRARKPSARSSWSAAPWSASSQVARETGYLEGVQPFHGMDVYGHLPPDKVVALCTGSQGEPRAALARIAAGRASRGGAVEGRPGDLLLAPHSRQREGDRPHHQRADRPGRRGHHRPHASGACVRPSAPGRAGGHDRLGQAAHRHSGARRGAASVRARGAGAAARRAAR